MEMKPWMVLQPFQHFRRFVCRQVVQPHMDIQSCIDLRINYLQEADELLMGVPPVELCYGSSVKYVECSEQIYGSIALVIVGYALCASFAMPFRPWCANLLRHNPTVFGRIPSSSAIFLFSSPPAALRTIRERSTRRCGVERPLDHDSSCLRSSSVSFSGAAIRI